MNEIYMFDILIVAAIGYYGLSSSNLTFHKKFDYIHWYVKQLVQSLGLYKLCAK